MNELGRAEGEALWFLAVAFWLLSVIGDRAKAKKQREAAEREASTGVRTSGPERVSSEPALSPAERGERTTQEEAEELERWLRERLGMPAPADAPAPPAPPPAPRAPEPQLPAPRRVPTAKPPRPVPTRRTRDLEVESRRSGPLGRAPDRALPEAEAIEERTSLEVDRPVTSYDDVVPVREASRYLDLDEESAKAAQRRLDSAEARNRAHTAQDHDDFHRRISAPDAMADEAVVRTAARRRALRAAILTGEVLAPPVSLRPPR